MLWEYKDTFHIGMGYIIILTSLIVLINTWVVMSKGVPVGVQSSTPTLTHEKPYPSEGYGFVEGTGKPMGNLRVIWIKITYKLHRIHTK